MKKLLVIAVCCMLFCGCKANREINNNNNNFQSNEKNETINYENKFLYCGIYTKIENNTIYSYEWYEIYFNNKGNTSKICYTVLMGGKNLGTSCDMEISSNIINYNLVLDYYKKKGFTCFLEDIKQ